MYLQNYFSRLEEEQLQQNLFTNPELIDNNNEILLIVENEEKNN